MAVSLDFGSNSITLIDVSARKKDGLLIFNYLKESWKFEL